MRTWIACVTMAAVVGLSGVANAQQQSSSAAVKELAFETPLWVAQKFKASAKDEDTVMCMMRPKTMAAQDTMTLVWDGKTVTLSAMVREDISSGQELGIHSEASADAVYPQSGVISRVYLVSKLELPGEQAFAMLRAGGTLRLSVGPDSKYATLAIPRFETELDQFYRCVPKQETQTETVPAPQP